MSMRLKDLRALVNETLDIDEATLVVMSKDAEGNGFSPLSDYSTGKYRPDSTWSGEYYNDDDVGDDDDNCVPVLCLWPVN